MTSEDFMPLANQIKVKLLNFKPKYNRPPRLIVFNYDLMSQLSIINDAINKVKLDLAIMYAINFEFSPRVRPDDFEVY